MSEAESGLPGTALGVDVGGTKILAVRLAPDSDEIVADAVQASPKSGPDLISEVVAAAGRLAGGRPESVGMGVPGLVDISDTVRIAPNLQGVVGTDLGRSLRERLPGTRFWIGNDATAACWGEYVRGAGAGYRDMLMVTLGTGIGGGIVTAGKLIEGSNRFAGEFGHMIVDPNGPQCPCGRRGCWERFASGAGLGSLGREMALAGQASRVVELAGDPEAVKGEHVTMAAHEGDPSAIEIMNRFAGWVALGLANLATILDPEIIVVGGGLVQAGEVLMTPTRQALAHILRSWSVPRPCRIAAASLGAQAGAIGAGLLGQSLGT